MKRLTDQDLEALLNDTESDLAERKQAFRGDVPKKARQAVCAFANDLPNHNEPGVLFIGAKDNGEPSRIQVTDQLLLSLADMKTDGNILPLPVLSVEKRMLKGAEMAVVTVMPSDMPPVKYAGRTWIRTGPRRSIANEQEERILIERRRTKLLPFDLHPVPTATLQDLSKLLFEEEYLPKAIAPDRLEINGRSYAEWLATCRMVVSPEDPTPTVAGILTLCKHAQQFLPCARIQFLRIDGLSWGDDVIDEQRMDGTIQKQLEMLDQKLMSHNRVAVDIVSAPTEIRHYQYPLSALQQLTRNALMHRSYEGTNSPVMVYWFNDRIEIINAGSPFGRVTPENFGQPGFADYRNPTLAETMKTLGFVQRFGVGIQMAQKDLKENGNPPAEFTFDMTTVICTLRQPLTDRSIAVSKESDSALLPGLSRDQVTGVVTPVVTPEVTPEVRLVGVFNGEMNRQSLQDAMSLKDDEHFRKTYLLPALEAQFIEMTIPDKPRSSKQRYRLTEKGKKILEREK